MLIALDANFLMHLIYEVIFVVNSMINNEIQLQVKCFLYYLMYHQNLKKLIK